MLVLGDGDTSSGAASLESRNSEFPCSLNFGLAEGNKFSSPVGRATCMRGSKGIRGSLTEDLGFYVSSSKSHRPQRRKGTGWGVEKPES